MLKFKVKIYDKGVFDQIKGKTATLKAGFLGGQMYEAIDEAFYGNEAKENTKGSWNEKIGKPRRFSARKQMPVAQVALIQEYGDPSHNIPPRPFMKWTVYKNAKKWKEQIRRLIYDTMSLKATLEDIGPVVAEDIQDMITDWSEPPNAQSTVKQKGFNNPLIDSGQLRDSVRYKVE